MGPSSTPPERSPGSFLSSVKAFAAKKLPDIAAELKFKGQDEAGSLHYPDNLWDYLDGDYHSDLPYMPSRDDRQLISGDEKRLRIWDFFFRFKPDDVGQPQKRKIEELQKERSKQIKTYGDKVGQKLKKINNVLDIFSGLLETESRRLNNQAPTEQLVPLDEWEQTLLRLQEALADENEVQREFLDHTLFLVKKLLTLLASVKSVMPTTEWVENLKRESDSENLAEIIKNRRLQIDEVISEIIRFKREHQGTIAAFDEQFIFLQDSVRALIEMIPEPPSAGDVRLWLEQDLGELRRRSIAKAAIGTRLDKIAYYDENNDERECANPISFVSPAELQAPERMPPAYLPPQLNLLQRFSSQVQAELAERFHWQPPKYKALPDRVKHLQAKWQVDTNIGIQIFYGLYYVEYLMIGDDMMTMVSFFYDFIHGKTTGERVTELYFNDIVALEQSQEYRTITYDYQDSEAVQHIEDMPVFHISLPNGERHSITFINNNYLTQVLNIDLPSAGEMPDLELSMLQDSQILAEAAVGVLRHRLRMHKSSS